jgi:RNA polymerase sigma-70 factor (ECF subfamily)
VSERLVEQARRGDADAFVALIEERQVAMTRVATAILRDPADVADALQETLLSLWRELPALRSVEAFPAWADRVLVNACRLVLRRRGRRRLREIALPAAAHGGGGPTDPSPERTPTFDADLADRDAFDRAFETLGADARAILVLHHLEGRAVADIASVLGIPVGTAKSRLFTARRQLGDALERERSESGSTDLAVEGPR